MKLNKKIAGMVAGLAMIVSGAAFADDWKPNGTLRLQIGFGAGGSTDTMGRVIAKVMKEQTGWNIIAENKTGGGGVAMFTGISQRPATGNVIGMGVNMPIMINLVIWIALIIWALLRAPNWR
jgi:tripartite-type tricarboxylate transporter receptor subunit TctC